MSRPIARRVAAVAGVVIVSLLSAAGPAGAVPALVEATAVVDIDEEGTAEVELGYVITGGADEPAAETLSFSALRFDGVAVEEVEVATADGQELDVSVDSAELKTTATVTLAEPLPPGDDIELTVRYSAPGAGTVDGDQMTTDVPVLAFDLPAGSTAPGIFTASVLLAPNYQYVEGFPANPETVGETSGRAEVVYDVPAMTSLLRTVATSGDAPLFTLTRTVDLLLLVTLLAGAVALYFSFTRGRRRAAEVAAPERRH